VQSGGVSSLIFLVVIGVWAAYFIQYWVRRRDHLVTARSVDQFSESMRVLERRTPLPADVTAQAREPLAADQPHPARAQLLLKRAATSPVSATVRPGSATGAGSTTAAGPAVAGGRRNGRTDASTRVAARRNRAMVMLGALSTWLVAIPLVALGMLGAAYLVVPVASVLIAMGWVRRNARSEASRTTADGARSQSSLHDTPTSRPGDERVVRARPGQGAAVGWVETRLGEPARAGTRLVEHDVASSNPAEANPLETGLVEPGAATTRVRGELYDLEAIEADNALTAAAHAAAAHAAAALPPVRPTRLLVDEDDIPLTWDPVPVPRPTYTLKARATRPAPTAADLVGDADTEYAAHADELPARRVAGA
jgi:hypothetical protein